MRSKARFIGLLTVFLLVAAACGDDDDAATTSEASGTTATTATTAAPADALRIALVLPGSANDGGFNQLAFESLALLEEEFGAETAFVESTPVNEYVKAYEDYANDGYDIVIGQGFQFGEVAAEVGPNYPDTLFLVTNNPATSGPNLQGLQPASQHAAYVAGVAAGHASESGKVGGIGGQPFPVVVAQIEAFRLGVLSVNPDADVTLTYLGSFDDVEKGKETARAMISDGVDVIYHIADSAGIGVIQATDEEGVLVIGWGVDQTELAPDAVLTSQIVDQRLLILEVVRTIVDGDFSGEQRFFGLDTPVLDMAPVRVVDADLAATIETAIDETTEGIIGGTIEVPFIAEPQN